MDNLVGYPEVLKVEQKLEAVKGEENMGYYSPAEREFETVEDTIKP